MRIIGAAEGSIIATAISVHISHMNRKLEARLAEIAAGVRQSARNRPAQSGIGRSGSQRSSASPARLSAGKPTCAVPIAIAASAAQDNDDGDRNDQIDDRARPQRRKRREPGRAVEMIESRAFVRHVPAEPNRRVAEGPA